MPISNSKRRFLTFKHQTLLKEKEECKSIMALITREIYDLYSKKFKKTENKKEENTSPPPELSCSEFKVKGENKEADPTENEKTPKNPEIKKIFRKIAFKIHPDKLIDLESSEREKKIKLYQRASAAAEDEDLLTLSEIAMDLGLAPPNFSIQAAALIEQKIKSLKKEIEDIQSTLMWNWHFTEKKETKNKILQKLFGIIHEERQKNNTGT